MANSVVIHSREEKDAWRDLFDNSNEVVRYRFINQSDYSGYEEIAEWDEISDI